MYNKIDWEEVEEWEEIEFVSDATHRFKKSRDEFLWHDLELDIRENKNPSVYSRWVNKNIHGLDNDYETAFYDYILFKLYHSIVKSSKLNTQITHIVDVNIDEQKYSIRFLDDNDEHMYPGERTDEGTVIDEIVELTT